MARRTKGTGSIRERAPGVWEVRAPVGGRQKSRIARGPRKEAEKALRALLGEVDAGAHRGRRRTVSELLERYFELREPDWSPTTVQAYRSYLDKHITPAIGSKPLDALGTDDLDELYMALRAKLSASSIHQCHAIIHGALKQARRWRWLVANPADETTRPPVRREKVAAPSYDDVKAVGAAVRDNPEYATFLWLKANSGLRRGEMCGLRWPRVDWSEGSIDVCRAVIALKGGGTQEKDTKGHNERTVPLDPLTMEALRRHRQAMEERAVRLGTALVPDAYVFSMAPDGSTPWNPPYATAQFRRLKDRLALDFRQHDVRHMYITELLPYLDPVNIAELSGHTDASMIYRVYGHPTREQGKKAAAVFGALNATKEPTPEGAGS